MAYIGPEPNPGQNREVDDISSGFNGGTASFTLQVNGQNVSPGSANAIIVSLGGVVQNPGTDYTVSASTITFTTAPANGLSFFGLVLGQQVDTEGTADDSIGATQLQSNAVTTAKIADSTGSSDGITTAKIADDAVTFAKMQNTANGVRFLGKHDSGGGEIGEITAAQARTMLNVADGATAGGGKILQVKNANKPDQFDSNSTSFVDVASLSIDITAASSSNKMLVTCHVFANCEDSAVLRLMFDSTPVGNGQGGDGGTNNQGFAMVRQDDGNLGSGYGIQILHTPGDTSQHTYKIQARTTTSNAQIVINRRSDNLNFCLASSITVMEVSA